jgi:hypothetical protein
MLNIFEVFGFLLHKTDKKPIPIPYSLLPSFQIALFGYAG